MVVRAQLASLLLTAALPAQALVPAGTINGALQPKPTVVLAPAEPAAVLRYVAAIHKQFFSGGELLSGKAAADADLRGKSAVVYATPAEPWFDKHRASLPFQFDADAVTIEGQRFAGAHLRVIAAMRNPDDRAQKVLLYAAVHTADLVDVNAVFHGPTEWVVADGGKVLASGSFKVGALSPEQMRQDLDELVATVTAVHAAAVEGLPEEVQAAAAKARAALAAGLEPAQFARLCAGVLLALHDAHSALALPRTGPVLALPFVWLESGLYVTAAAGPLQKGDRILAIAGRDEPALLQVLAANVPAENPHWLRQQAPALLSDLSLLRAFGLAQASPLTVRIAREGKEQDVQVGPGALPARPRDPAWVRYEIDAAHSLGVFTLDRCEVDATYRDTLDQFFAAVHDQKIGKVAVDLRANGGGNSGVVDEFLRYLDVAEYRSFMGDVRWSAQSLAQRHEPGEPRYQPGKPGKRKNAPRKDPPPFHGQLFVLTGPQTFSSANWFAVVVHDNKLGTIVGEPTGNAPSSYGDVLTFTLPNSGLGYTLSFKRWVRPDPTLDPAPCLLPDVSVPRTAATLLSGSDPVLEWLQSR
jgi:C-terminal processing protease CtpA/Prc